MDGLKKWIALLATITLLLLSMLSGLISAAPVREDKKQAEEQSTVEDGASSLTEPIAVVNLEEGATGGGEGTTPSDGLVVLTEPVANSGEEVKGSLPEAPPPAPQVGDLCDECEPWKVTSLDISKTVDRVALPGFEASLDKKGPESPIEMEVGESKDITFTIDVSFQEAGAYSIAGSIFVDNTGEWPAHVKDIAGAVSDTVWYKTGPGDWQPATSNIVVSGLGPDDYIPVEGGTYPYSGTFTLPVPLSSVTAMSNLIEITIDNKPDPPKPGMQDWTYHFRQDFDKPTDGQSALFELVDVEKIDPATGLSYVVKSATINPSAPSTGDLSWELDPANGPYQVEIVKTLTAEEVGTYILNNKAMLDGLEDEVDVEIIVKEQPLIGKICGTKWEDLNCNGRHDCGEPPVEGVVIELWKDGELVASTETGANGRYCFKGLELGEYTLKEILSGDWYPKNPASGEQSVTLTRLNPWKCHVNFINARYGMIYGFKFFDKNCNGRWDRGEPGIEGVTIWLNGESSAVTDGNGYFCFDGLMPGKYTVEVDESTAPENTYPSTKNPVCVNLGCGEEVRVCFGNAPYGDVCGYKFLDVNCNGVMDEGEEGIPGVKILLWSFCGIQETWTDADGYYCFDGLKPGLYKVWLDGSTVPEGHYHTTWTWKMFWLCCGESERIDFGNAEYGEVCGYKFLDTNCNGVMDEGEEGIPGVKIMLWSFCGIQETWTDADGYYCFDGLKPGLYKVWLDGSTVPEGHYHTTCTWKIFWLCCGESERIDFGNARYLSISGTKWDGCMEDPVEGILIELWKDGEKIAECTTDENGEYSFTGLKPGTYTVQEALTGEQLAEWYMVSPEDGKYEDIELVCGQDIEGLDFVNARYLSISGTKWEDTNANGNPDGTEDGVPGVTIELLDAEDNVIKTTTTDADGNYSFTGLMPGTYSVQEKLTTEQMAEWSIVYPEKGTYTGIELVCGQDIEGQDFFNCRYRNIAGYKYNDANANGLQDDTEVPWNGSVDPITVELYQNGNLIQTTVIDNADGMYEFTDLLPGDYTIVEIIPANSGIESKAPTFIDVTLTPDADLVVEKVFLNYIVEAGPIVIVPPEQPQVGVQQLPATGLNQLPLVLAAAALILLGLMALMLGLLQLRRS